MKLFIIALDYIFAFVILMLFLVFTSFGDQWPPFTIRLFFVSCFLGMTIAQMLFPPKLSRMANDSGLLFRNALGVSVTFITSTYITMRVIDRPGIDTGRWLVIIGAMFFLCFLIYRWLQKLIMVHLWSKGVNVVRIVAIGTGQNFCQVIKSLHEAPGLGFRVVGCYSDNPQPDGLKVYGTLAKGVDIINSGEPFPVTVDAVLCGLPISHTDSISVCSSYCNNHILRFYYIPSNDHIGIHLKPMMIGSEELFTTFRLPLSLQSKRFVKRVFDIVFSVCVLIPLGLFIPIIAYLIKRQSPGPIFFKQARTGMDGRTFMCYKFRSMHINKEADNLQATKDDPRKFPFGNFIRKCNIDELPQFWNVLKNDMSVVGPRPHMLKHTEQYSSLLDKYMVRHFVKPGITGWAQVSGFRGETKELWQMENRVKYDIWYIEHWTVWLDIRIILLTIKSVFVHDKHAY